MLHMDDTACTDSSSMANTITKVGTAARSSTQSVFGGYSFVFDGDSDYLTVPDNVIWQLDGGAGNPFVIDARFYTTTGGRAQIFGQLNGAVEQEFYLEADGRLYFGIYSSGWLLQFSCPWSPSINTWYHVALVRVDNSNSADGWRLYINGTKQTLTKASGNWNANCLNVAADVRIGAYSVGQYMLNGYIDELRVSVGTHRDWTGATITVPTEAYSADAIGGFMTTNKGFWGA